MNQTEGYSSAVHTARNYYNSDDADNFYATIWGGEDIHVGLYHSNEDLIADASHRTVERLASLLINVTPNSRIIDLGSGYGGAARFLAKKFGCHVVALNLSEVENERNRQLNRVQGLDRLITVVDGSFEKIPFDEDSFDVAWSQDAILHSGHRAQVISEVARILKPKGEFVFTDPMQANQCPAGVLQPILERIHLESLGSSNFYQSTAERCGLVSIAYHDHTQQLVNHYEAVLRETQRRERDLLKNNVSPEYIDRMKKGLSHWVEGGKRGHLAWGFFHFRKNPAP